MGEREIVTAVAVAVAEPGEEKSRGEAGGTTGVAVGEKSRGIAGGAIGVAVAEKSRGEAGGMIEVAVENGGVRGHGEEWGGWGVGC